MKLLFLWKK